MSPVLRNPAPLLYFDPSGALDFFQAPAYQDILYTYPVPLADIWNQDGTPNSATNPAHLGSTVTIFATGFSPLSGVPADGAPGGANPQYPAQPILYASAAEIPVWTPNGNLAEPLLLPITTIAGHSNSLLQLTATIPSYFSPGPLPFFIGTWTSGGVPAPRWTNFLYTVR
ncbi:MAG: hypothetical protein P4L56_00795 [Candidatus Sulfopaludibacter sp.]|nr:hypothetical protein [Candidatus Sulfopaludibacter sp.]